MNERTCARCGERLLADEEIRSGYCQGCDADKQELWEFYQKAKDHTEKNFGETVQWVRSRRLDIISHSEFITEYVFVVSCSGFKASIVQERFERLAQRMQFFKPSELSKLGEDEMISIYKANMIRNNAKAKAIAKRVKIGRYKDRSEAIRDALRKFVESEP